MKLKTIAVALALLATATDISAKEAVWYDGKKPVSYNLSGEVAPVVMEALKMWSGDMDMVTGKTPVADKGATIQITELDKCSDAEKKKLQKEGVPVVDLEKGFDTYYLANHNGTVRIVGGNGRGTAYAILELSRHAGVSPWVFWSDAKPAKRNRLALPDGFKEMKGASVEYRGIFINDEDWTLQPWSWKNFENGVKKGMIGPKTYKEVFKLLLRLRANAIWPGMHGITTPFYLVPGAKETADSCGIAIGTSHCEPLMRNNVGEWSVKERGNYNYITNKKSVLNYWTERLIEVNKYENLYTIGMRGVHDGSMEGVKTLQEKTDALQRVIYDQRDLIARHVNPDVTQVPQMFVPYKEVLEIMENGLDVPEDVTLIWCDDNYGYMTRLSDAEQQKRKGGAGVYYHLSYWGRPHDYMWLTTNQPGLTYNEMREAYDRNARKVWIVNVHDLKPAAYPLELFLDLAWDINSVGPQTIRSHMERWLCREFGEKEGKRLTPVMEEYYRLCAIRKPEFMGWSQVELDKKKYRRGWSPVIDTEFSFAEMGNEADRYLHDYQKIRRQVLEIEKDISADRRDTYFSHIKYQVLGAADMAAKMLEAQRSRNAASPEEAQLAANRSMSAFNDIKALTDQYNNEMSGGFWKHSMCFEPRDLHAFKAPTLPVEATGNVDVWQYEPVGNYFHESLVAVDADKFHSSSAPVECVQMLGHSMNAVRLPKGESLTYRFNTETEGNANLTVAVLPTQPSDKGNIRFSVSVDGAEPTVFSIREKGRTNTWKLNVLRNQARKSMPVALSKGEHTLEIRALDDHIVVDQWLVDFNKNRKHYTIPTRQ